MSCVARVTALMLSIIRVPVIHRVGVLDPSCLGSRSHRPPMWRRAAGGGALLIVSAVAKPARLPGQYVAREGCMRAMDVMTTNVIIIDPDSSVQALATLLSERGISGVPVVDRD